MNSNTISLTNNDKIYIGEIAPKGFEIFAFSKLKLFSLYFNYIKISIILLFIFLYVKEFQNIIESVKEIRTFQEENVLSFKKIGKYLLIITILMSYSSYAFQGGVKNAFYVSSTPLILSLLAYVMSEIFKEGNKLLEENKLTV